MLSFFSYACWPSSLKKSLFMSSYFLIGLFGFRILCYISSLYILDTNILLDKPFANIFSHTVEASKNFYICIHLHNHHPDHDKMIYFHYIFLTLRIPNSYFPDNTFTFSMTGYSGFYHHSLVLPVLDPYINGIFPPKMAHSLTGKLIWTISWAEGWMP